MSKKESYKLADGSLSTDYKAGDEFKVVFSNGTEFSVESVITLIKDDGSLCPKFRLVKGEWHYIGEEAYYRWDELKPYKKKSSKIDNLQKQIDELKEIVDTHINLPKEASSGGVTPLWKQVLEQGNFYNGHGKMTLGQLTLGEIRTLLEYLSANCGSMNDLFHLSLYAEDSGYWAGSIYQDNGIDSNTDKLWLGGVGYEYG